MIMRMWRGWTRPDDTEAYASYIKETGIAAYEATPGNRGAYLISRPDGDKTEFVTISFWDSREAIEAFAGADIEQAVFYPEDDRYLVDRETTVSHFTVH
jgi:heme-degrading monooxygenase HmoA